MRLHPLSLATACSFPLYAASVLVRIVGSAVFGIQSSRPWELGVRGVCGLAAAGGARAMSEEQLLADRMHDARMVIAIEGFAHARPSGGEGESSGRAHRTRAPRTVG